MVGQLVDWLVALMVEMMAAVKVESKVAMMVG